MLLIVEQGVHPGKSGALPVTIVQRSFWFSESHPAERIVESNIFFFSSKELPAFQKLTSWLNTRPDVFSMPFNT